MDYCPNCNHRLVRVEQTGPASFTATDQDTNAPVPIPPEVAESYAREGRIPVSFACTNGWPTSYRGVQSANSVYSRNGAQHVDGTDHGARAGELPGVFVRSSHPACRDPFAVEYADRVR